MAIRLKFESRSHSTDAVGNEFVVRTENAGIGGVRNATGMASDGQPSEASEAIGPATGVASDGSRRKPSQCACLATLGPPHFGPPIGGRGTPKTDLVGPVC